MIDPRNLRDRAAADAQTIVRHFLGEPNRKVSNRRELRWGRHGSFMLTVPTGRWHDWETGEHGDTADLIIRETGGDQRTAFGWLCRWLGVEAGAVDKSGERHSQRGVEMRHREADAARGAAQKRAEALRFFDEAQPLLMSPAEAYLIRRLAGRQVPHSVVRSTQLRFHPRPYSKVLRERPVRDAAERETIGAMVARMVDPITRCFVGVQRTFLDQDCGKIVRKMLGGSGVVTLVDRPHGDFALAEGVEKVARLLDVIGWDGPLWATMGTGNMAKFPVLDAVPGITIFADNDLPGRNDRRPGNNSAMACADRWQNAGRDALVLKPPVEGLDWDSYLGLSPPPEAAEDGLSGDLLEAAGHG